MDLSQLSTEDLTALQSGDLSKVSTEGLMHLNGGQAAAPEAPVEPPAPTAPVAHANPNAMYPVGSELSAGLTNAVHSAGAWWGDRWQGLRQMIGGPGAPTPEEVQARRDYYAPLKNAIGGGIGQAAAALPLGLVPGVGEGVLGAALTGGALGAAVGATEPTLPDESRAFNTVASGVSGAVGGAVGQKLSDWSAARASEPFMGWGQDTGNAAAARAVGSGAKKLNQEALNETNTRLGGIFGAARSPNVSTMVDPQGVQSALTSATGSLNSSSLQGLNASRPVLDLLDHATSGAPVSAQQLGTISSRLGAEASGEMSSRQGDRALGIALYRMKDHVDQLIGGTITDPKLAADYSAALPQYRTLQTLISRPSILNSSSGDVNLRSLGNFLQKSDKAGYAFGGNDSPLYQAARWGQVKGNLTQAPSVHSIPSLLSWGKFQLANSPPSRALGGAIANVAAPLSPVLQPGLQGLGIGSGPLALSYLEQ